MLSFEQFAASLQDPNPPVGLNVAATALWYAGKGNWHQAHTLIQDVEDKTAYHIHGFLHRQEGDRSNAEYWYRRAGKRMPATDTGEEWQDLVKEYL
jgi:hypothetical protein